MEAKVPKNLDPKLKEVYERVMGTKVPAQQSKPTPIPPKPTATVFPHNPPVQNITRPAPVAHSASQTFVAGNVKPKKTPLMLVLFIFLGIIFFLIYTAFWLKLFGIHLSFLPF